MRSKYQLSIELLLIQIAADSARCHLFSTAYKESRPSKSHLPDSLQIVIGMRIGPNFDYLRLPILLCFRLCRELKLGG